VGCTPGHRRSRQPRRREMTTAQATAEVFWTAFMAMSEKERRAFLERLIADPALREDLLDAALIEERRHEPTRPLEAILAGGQRKKAARAK
jgi:hypothetical protein